MKLIFTTPINKLIYLAVILLPVFAMQKTYAQQDLTLYNMSAVPQSIYDNPSFRPSDNTVFVTMPLASQYLNLSNTGFKLSDLVQHNGDSLQLNGNNMVSKLAPENDITLNYHIDIFAFGFAWKKNYFSFDASEKIDFRFTYSQDFMNFLLNGNAATMGQTLNMSPALNFTHYRDYSFGWSRQIGKRLALGARFHYLYGMENVTTETSDITLYTNPTNYDITAQSNILVNTTGVNSTSFNNFNLVNYLFKETNTGEAIDLGFTYKLTKRLIVSASVTDLGFINWNDGVANYQSNVPNATFTYQGLDLNNLLDNNTVDLGSQLQTIGDSVQKTFKVNTLHNSYTTMLTSQLYANASYNLTKASKVAVLFYGQVYNNSINPAITWSYSQQLGRRIMASLSYSVYNRSDNNVGFGLAVNTGAMQFFTVSNNALGYFYPQNAKNLTTQFGFNLTWRHKKPKAIPQSATPPAPIPTPTKP